MVALLCHHRHHCTIKQPSLAQRQRTETVLFYCTDITKHTGKTFAEASFLGILLLFGYIIVLSPPPLHNQTNFRCTKTKDENRPFLLQLYYQTHKQSHLQKQVFPCTLICFAAQLHLHCLVQKTAQRKCTVRFLFDLLQLKS